MSAKRPYLEALDIPLWLPRQTLVVHPQPAPSAPEIPAEDSLPSGGGSLSSSDSLPPDPPPPEGKEWGAGDTAPPMDEQWTPPPDDDWKPVMELDDPADVSPPHVISREARIARLDWEYLTAEAGRCEACELCKTRKYVVFGVGNRQAEWLVIGEAPGADEDQQGEPFVGRAGKLLNPMLLAIGLKREQVYIANILKCRPPENREPTPVEAAKCRPFLERQIELIQPRIILAVGRVAAQNLLNTDTQIGKLRGQVHRLGPSRIPVVVTYHPAYLLRSPREKRKSWDDLRLARRTLAAEPPAAARRTVDS